MVESVRPGKVAFAGTRPVLSTAQLSLREQGFIIKII